MNEKLPVVARLYYTGIGSRRYKRASTRNGPGEPLSFTSVAEEALRRERANVDNLAILAKRLVQELRKVSPDNVLASVCVDYLVANGLSGEVMRDLGHNT